MTPIITALIALLASVAAAYITALFALRSERRKWQRDFAIQYIEAKSRGEDYLTTFCMQHAIAFLSITRRTGFDSPEKLFLAPQSRLLIGRDPSADICLPQDGISSKHALINASWPCVTICNLDAKTPIFIRRGKVTTSVDEEEIIRHGDLIEIGECTIFFYSYAGLAQAHYRKDRSGSFGR